MIEFSGGAKLYEQNEAEQEVLMGEFLVKGSSGMFRYGNDEKSSSALLLNMASSLISGTDYFGCKVHRKCKVLFVQREQDIPCHWKTEPLHTNGVSVPVVDTNLSWENDEYEQILDELIDELYDYCLKNEIDVVIIQDDSRLRDAEDTSVIRIAKTKFDKLTGTGAAVVYGVTPKWSKAEKTYADWTINLESTDFNIGDNSIYELLVNNQFLAMYYRDACGIHVVPRQVTEQKYYH